MNWFKRILFLTMLTILGMEASAAGLNMSLTPPAATYKYGQSQAFVLTYTHPQATPEVVTIVVTCDYEDAAAVPYSATSSANINIIRPYKIKQIALPFFLRLVANSVKVNGVVTTPNAAGNILMALEINEGESCVINFTVK